MNRLHFPIAASVLLLVGCTSPTVNLSTQEPLKVDIAMRLDVYQHTKEQGKTTAITAKQADPDQSRIERLAEVQSLKNSRLVGEGVNALLVIRVETPGDYGAYIRKIVEAENADRIAVMKEEAARQKSSLPQLQKKQADLARKMAFKGEWIELEKSDGTTEWIQKGD
jgi:hypothetical protein